MSLRLIPTVANSASGEITTDIDLTAPGGVAALLEFHRRQFGTSRMDVEISDNDKDEDEDDDTSGDDDSTNGSDEGGDDKPSKKDKDDDESTELERARARMKAADRRAAEAERKLREKDDAGKPELEIAQRRVTELEETTTQQDATLRELRIQNAFLMSNTVTWHDPSDALRELANMDGVDIDDDGKVTGVKDAIAKLAKRKPHWVKAAKESDDEDKDSSTEASGSKMHGKRKGEKDVPTREALVPNYPALARKR